MRTSPSGSRQAQLRRCGYPSAAMSTPSTLSAHRGVPLPEAELTLISVSYQTGAEITRMVESLRAHPPSLPWHLVLIDNASPDGSGPELAARFAGEPDATVVLSDTNLGFGVANNRIAQTANSPYIGFINPDCEIVSDPFGGMVDYLRSHPEAGVTGAVFLAPDGNPQSSPRRFPSPAAGLGGRNSPIRKLWPGNPWTRHYLMEDQPAGEPTVCDWVAGTVMVVRREEFLRLGGFDPDYFLYWEDADLCWRYRHELGLHAVYLPTGEVRHIAGAASDKIKPFSVRQFNKGARILVRKRLYPSPWHPLRWFALAALAVRERILLAKVPRI